MEYYLAIKGKVVPVHATTQMYLENMLNKSPDTKDHIYDFIYIKSPE